MNTFSDLIFEFAKTITESMNERNKIIILCKDVIGELLRIERKEVPIKIPEGIPEEIAKEMPRPYVYDLDIWDVKKHTKVSFTDVHIFDIKILNGVVSFGE